jgi:UDP-N-acetylglucosamine 2-epimerase
MHVALVTGTRPQIIKSAPVLQALAKEGINVAFIHTGQHYDFEMAAQFLKEFGLQELNVNLNVRSDSPTIQIQEIILRLYNELKHNIPEYLIVPGDTNSALGAALTGFKMGIPVCHIESGLRSFDMTMPEEINRRLIDHGSAGLFAPTEAAIENLTRESVRGDVYLTGDTMYDILKERIPFFSSEKFINDALKKLQLCNKPYAMLTLHRSKNVDVQMNLESVLTELDSLDFDIIFPVHPRTKKRFTQWGISLSKNVHPIKPLRYDEMMALLQKASLILTDSGGLQKEAYLLNTPCVTIRGNSEWLETFEADANILAPVSSGKIADCAKIMWGKILENNPLVYGDGHASEKIAHIIGSGEIEIKDNLMTQFVS